MSRRMVRVFTATASALAVTAGTGLTAAEATKVVNIASHISIKGKGLTFSGKVTSPNTACVSGRTVTLWRTNGNKLGTTTTGAAGKWKITASGSAGISLGHFFAKVKKRSEGTAGTIFVCKAATSNTIPFHQ
jgi:hypothetical protein